MNKLKRNKIIWTVIALIILLMAFMIVSWPLMANNRKVCYREEQRTTQSKRIIDCQIIGRKGTKLRLVCPC